MINSLDQINPALIDVQTAPPTGGHHGYTEAMRAMDKRDALMAV